MPPSLHLYLNCHSHISPKHFKLLLPLLFPSPLSMIIFIPLVHIESLLVAWVKVKVFPIIKHSGLFKKKLTWSWDILTFTSCQILFANILMRVFAFLFSRDKDLQSSFIIMPLIFLSMRLMLTSRMS